MDEAKALLEKSEKIGDSCIITGRVSAVSPEQVRGAVDMVKKKEWT